MNARDALKAYMAQLRESPLYVEAGEPTPKEECDRILSQTTFSPGDGWSGGWPEPLPNGDRCWGPKVWVGESDERGAKVQVFQLAFVQRHCAVDGWMLTHTLAPSGSGSVWLGECNNSARVDLVGREAWAAWCARPEGVGEIARIIFSGGMK